MNQTAVMAEPKKTTEPAQNDEQTTPTANGVDNATTHPEIESKYPWESYAVEKILLNGDNQQQIGYQEALNFYFKSGRISIYRKITKKSKWIFATYKRMENETIVEGVGFETFIDYVLVDQIELDNTLALVSIKRKDKIKTMINTAKFSIKKNAADIILNMTIKMVEHIDEINVELDILQCEENKIPVFDKVENPSWFNVLRMIRTGMYIVDTVPYTVGLATFLSNKIEDSEPIWTMQIGVPGIGKTVFTKNLIPNDIYSNAWVIQLSELTSKTLISGKEDTEDLLPLIIGKLLLFSDFTTMLSKKPDEVLAIFNQLREMYDGKYAKGFGSGVGVKHHTGTFSILANVTNKYDTFKNQLAMVGDRFISVRFKPSSHEFSKKITESAYNNTQIDPEVSKAISNEMLSLYVDFNPDALAPIEDEWGKDIQHCAMITAALRIPIDRDMYAKGRPITVKPAKEEATRLVKVYKKMAQVLCYVLEKPEFDLEVLSYIYRITLDTPEELRVITLSSVKSMACGIDDVCDRVGLENNTISNVLVDLKYAGLVRMEHEEIVSSNQEGTGTETEMGEMQYSLNGSHSPILHYIKDIESKLDELPGDKKHHNCTGISVLHDLKDN